jgi:hypothetical protein
MWQKLTRSDNVEVTVNMSRVTHFTKVPGKNGTALYFAGEIKALNVTESEDDIRGRLGHSGQGVA